MENHFILLLYKNIQDYNIKRTFHAILDRIT